MNNTELTVINSWELSLLKKYINTPKKFLSFFLTTKTNKELIYIQYIYLSIIIEFTILTDKQFLKAKSIVILQQLYALNQHP
jgi:hypothetical protein